MNEQASTNPSRKTPWSFLETPWWPKLQKFIFLLAIVMAVVLLVNPLVWKTDYWAKLRDMESFLIRLACGLGGVIIVAGVKKILGDVTDELKTKIFKGTLIYTAVVGGFLVLSLNSGYMPTGGDNAYCFRAAEGEGGGVTYSLQMAHQDPFIFLIRCFNHFLGARNYVAFFVLNLVSLLVIVACVGKISDLIFKDNKTTAIALLLTASFSPIFLHLPSINGNMPGLACLLLAIYFWLSRRRGWILACVLASILAVLFKATFSAFLLFWFFWGAVASLQKGCFARYLVIPLLCFLASSFAQTQFIRFYEEYHKLDSKKTPHVPKVRWIAMGLQSGFYEKEKGRGIDYVTSPKNMDRIPVGTWTGFLYDIHANAPIAESKLQSYEAIRKSLRGFCADPCYAFEFFSRKIATVWGCPDFSTHPYGKNSMWQNTWDSAKVGEVQKLILDRKSWLWIGLEYTQEGWHFIVLLFSMIGFVFLFRGGNSTKSPEALLIALIPLGGFALYLLWEVSPLYGMPLFLFLIMVSAHGIAHFSWTGLWAWFAKSKRVSGLLPRFRQSGRS